MSNIESTFKPMPIEDANKIALKQYNMTYSELEDFIISVFYSFIKRGQTPGLADIIPKIKRNEYFLRIRDNSIAVDDKFDIKIAYSMSNLDQIYKIEDKIGIKAWLPTVLKRQKDSVIIYDIKKIYPPNNKIGIKYIGSFLKANGEKGSIDISNVIFPDWKGVTANDVTYLIRMRSEHYDIINAKDLL